MKRAFFSGIGRGLHWDTRPSSRCPPQARPRPAHDPRGAPFPRPAPPCPGPRQAAPQREPSMTVPANGGAGRGAGRGGARGGPSVPGRRSAATVAGREGRTALGPRPWPSARATAAWAGTSARSRYGPGCAACTAPGHGEGWAPALGRAGVSRACPGVPGWADRQRLLTTGRSRLRKRWAPPPSRATAGPGRTGAAVLETRRSGAAAGSRAHRHSQWPGARSPRDTDFN